VLLLIDNYDSFTYNLKDYFEQLNQVVQVIRNDEWTLAEIQKTKWDGIIISPGPKTPNEAGISLAVIEAYHQNTPMLGVCLGHQALGVYFGASICQAQTPMHGKVSQIEPSAHLMFEQILKPFLVCRYHSLVLKDIPEVLEILATSSEGEVMAMAHKQLPLWGMQFHPEAILTQNGMQLLSNWLKVVNLHAMTNAGNQ
jgi:anthranilate synthase component 2